jgi:hypothetical protein
MTGLVAGGKSAVACSGSFKPDRGRLGGLVSRDGEAKIRAGSCGIGRGS